MNSTISISASIKIFMQRGITKSQIKGLLLLHHSCTRRTYGRLSEKGLASQENDVCVWYGAVLAAYT